MKSLAKKQRVPMKKAFQIHVPGMHRPLSVLQILVGDHENLLQSAEGSIDVEGWDFSEGEMGKPM